MLKIKRNWRFCAILCGKCIPPLPPGSWHDVLPVADAVITEWDVCIKDVQTDLHLVTGNQTVWLCRSRDYICILSGFIHKYNLFFHCEVFTAKSDAPLGFRTTLGYFWVGVITWRRRQDINAARQLYNSSNLDLNVETDCLAVRYAPCWSVFAHTSMCFVSLGVTDYPDLFKEGQRAPLSLFLCVSLCLPLPDSHDFCPPPVSNSNMFPILVCKTANIASKTDCCCTEKKANLCRDNELSAALEWKRKQRLLFFLWLRI